MFNERGGGSYIRGPSVHNQRIERLHYDTTHTVLYHFIELFRYLEENEVLVPDSESDLFALHHVFLPRIQNSLDEFRNAWNSHKLSTCGNKTPLQLWTLGMYDSRNQEQVAVQSAVERDWSMFGVEGFVVPPVDTDEEQTVALNDITIGEHDEQVRRILNAEFPSTLDDNNFGIDIYCDVRERVVALLQMF